MQILEVLDERAGHRPRSEPAVGDEELFAAVLPALFAIRGPLQGLIALNPEDAAELRQRASKLTEQAGDDAVAMARAILERAQPLKESA